MSTRAKTRSKTRSKQLSLPRTGGHGGRRAGAGRPPKLARGRVPHRERPPHAAYHPLHVTLRARANLPSLRAERVRAMLSELLRRRHRADFQIVHYTIQRDHLHLIAEADDKTALASGMNSLASRFAKRLNKLLGGRKGKVWDHRYHRRDLCSPTEVKRALAYVFGNWRKHGEAGVRFVDPFSSAPHFDGWAVDGVPSPWCPWRRPRERPPPRWQLEWGVGHGPATDPWRPPPSRTWLLEKGWRRVGLLRLA